MTTSFSGIAAKYEEAITPHNSSQKQATFSGNTTGGTRTDTQDTQVTVNNSPLDDVLVSRMPVGNGSDEITLRRHGSNVEVFDHGGNAVVAAAALEGIRGMDIARADDEPDAVNVDFAYGGFFALSDRIHITGGVGGGDALTIVGDGVASATVTSASGLAGEGLLEVDRSGHKGQIDFAGFEPVSILSMADVVFEGTLIVGDHAVTIRDRDRATLRSLTSLGNQTGPGRLAAAGGFVLEAGKTLAGYGVVDGDFENQGNVVGEGPNAADGLEFADDVTGSGDFEGNMTFAGTYAPGNSPAAIRFGGNVGFGDAAALIVDVGGSTAGQDYDQLQIAGQARLGGTLQIVPAGGDDFAIRDRFRIMEFGSSRGEFARHEGRDTGHGLKSEPVKESDHFQLAVIPASYQNYDNPYDVNDDGLVAPLDVLMLIADLNQNGPHVLPPISIKTLPDAFRYLDVVLDWQVAPLDVLRLVQYLNAHPPGGESEQNEQPGHEALIAGSELVGTGFGVDRSTAPITTAVATPALVWPAASSVRAPLDLRSDLDTWTGPSRPAVEYRTEVLRNQRSRDAGTAKHPDARDDWQSGYAEGDFLDLEDVLSESAPDVMRAWNSAARDMSPASVLAQGRSTHPASFGGGGQ